MEIKSSQIPTFLPRNFDTSSTAPQKLVSSFVAFVRPLDSPQSPPWMVLFAEPSRGVTQLFNPFTRTPVQNLDLTKFRTTILATECHIVDYGIGLFCSADSFCIKALLLSIPNSIENCHLFASFNNGQVCESHPFDGRHTYFQTAFEQKHYYVDDIIKYKGEILALDKRKALYKRRKRVGYCVDCNREFHFCNEFVRGKESADQKLRRRKRLVVSSSGDTLYIVEPCIMDRGNDKWPSGAIELYFRVYELDSTTSSWCRVSSFKDGDVEQVLFVTRDYCFFVAATEFPQCQLKNCIIFSDDAFPLYKGGWDYSQPKGRRTTEVAAIFSLDEDLSYSMPINTYPDFPVKLWTPPPWILHDASSPSQSKSQRSEAEKDGMAQSALPIKQDSEVVIRKKFQGIDVLPSHLPILQNVWMKHGDILEEIAVCSNDTKSTALSSLAKMLLILEAKKGNTLAKDQAQYVDSTFYDLQYMHLKVDWLAPSVEKALSSYKRGQFMELDKVKAKAEVRRKSTSSVWNWMIIFKVISFIFACAYTLLLLQEG